MKQIDTILKSRLKIGQKIAEFVGQDKYNEVLPYFPICGAAGDSILQKQQHLPDKRRVTYICKGGRIGKEEISHGNKGEVDIEGVEGKLAWKVEFAARWQALDVRLRLMERHHGLCQGK